MERLCVMVLLFLIHLLVLSLAENEYKNNKECPRFDCGKLGSIKFPFTTHKRLPHCGFLMIDGCDEQIQKIQLGERWYPISFISLGDTIFIHDEDFSKNLSSKSCETFNNLTFPSSPILSFHLTHNLTLLKCNPSVHIPSLIDHARCSNFGIFYAPELGNQPNLPSQCTLIQLPAQQNPSGGDIYNWLSANFSLDVVVSTDCRKCQRKRHGECSVSSMGEFSCLNPRKGRENWRLQLGLGFGIGVPSMMVLVLLLLHKRKHTSSKLPLASSSSDPFFKEDLEEDSVYFGVPVFSYNELEEATSNFGSEKEIGDGGFGTVYYGKLRDGREVAVKRLYKHNLKRFQQFINEVQILTRLRHRNLVTLYGCTSRRSKELLLVYEYLPNGTVADHLHGDRSKSSRLPWDIRMKIAIETATALAYLHASDTIHRDVKTNNILLDDNFCVKVADFGLSRLFPMDATHVSTAPQGTPGYVDPEYHQCYQLTGKSDVYSFGVVLIELISSMPAVDITRHRSEISLANLAISKIQKCAVEELVDPCLGYKTDEEIKRMTISVAELAFCCLQQEKDMRPTMVDVMTELIRIQIGDSEKNQEELVRIQSGNPVKNLEEDHDTKNTELKTTMPPPSPQQCDEDSLLKNIHPPPSPFSVTHKWVSCSTSTSDVSA